MTARIPEQRSSPPPEPGIEVRCPAEPPELTPAGARVLLRILRNMAESGRRRAAGRERAA